MKRFITLITILSSCLQNTGPSYALRPIATGKSMAERLEGEVSGPSQKNSSGGENRQGDHIAFLQFYLEKDPSLAPLKSIIDKYAARIEAVPIQGDYKKDVQTHIEMALISFDAMDFADRVIRAMLNKDYVAKPKASSAGEYDPSAHRLITGLIDGGYAKKEFSLSDYWQIWIEIFKEKEFSTGLAYADFKEALERGLILRAKESGHYTVSDDAFFEYLITDEKFIDIFNKARERNTKPSKETIRKAFPKFSFKGDFSVLKYDESYFLCFWDKGELWNKDSIYRVIRYVPNNYIDHMSAPRLDPNELHSANVMDNGYKFELLRDRRKVLMDYMEETKVYNGSEFSPIIEQLNSGGQLMVRDAILELRKMLEEAQSSSDAKKKKSAEFALRLLHTQMYAETKTERIAPNRLLHDIYTGRPLSFPESKSFKVVFHNQDQTIKIPKYQAEREARIEWAVNGKLQKPIHMKLKNGQFIGTIPIETATVHYAVEVKISGKWAYKRPGVRTLQASGVIKPQKDLRGKNVLEVRTSIFDLSKDKYGEIIKKEDGSLLISGFKDLKDKLADLKRLGYVSLWLMDCFEWGPIVYPGKDPSSFSPLDHITISEEMGGLKGLRELKKEADELGIELILNLIPHISKANKEKPAYFPVYTFFGGDLAALSSGDGQTFWDDSLQPNWRRKEVMDDYVKFAVSLAEEGYSFRADIGHAFDTTFEVDPNMQGLSRIFGDVVKVRQRPDGRYYTADLSGTTEPNVILSKIIYEIQKKAPDAVVYAENFPTLTEDKGWQDNSRRLIKSGVVPYSSLHEEEAHLLRDQRDVSCIIGHVNYMKSVHDEVGGQHIDVYSSHDYQRDPTVPEAVWADKPPLQLYGDGVIPFLSSLLLLNYRGPMLWHFARLQGEKDDDIWTRYNLSLAEFWKIWVNNIREFPYDKAVAASLRFLKDNPNLAHLGEYIASLSEVLREHKAENTPTVDIMRHDRDCLSILKQGEDCAILGFINYGYHRKDIYRPFANLPELKDGEIYELRELFGYTKKSGKAKGQRFIYIAGDELKRLGLHTGLEAWETIVYSIRPARLEENILPAYQYSLINYKRFGLEDRVNHSLVANEVISALKRKDINDFIGALIRSIKIAKVVSDIDVSNISTILFDIARFHPRYKDKMKDYLTRAILDESIKLSPDILENQQLRYELLKILRGMFIGEVAMIAMETRGVVTLGGLALYERDIAKTFADMGLDTTIATGLFSKNKEGQEILQSVIENARLVYTGKTAGVPVYGDRDHRAHIYRTMLDNEIQTLAIAGDLADILYGGETADEKLIRYRFFALATLEALRTYNIYPSVLHTGDQAGLAHLFLKIYEYLSEDPHFKEIITRLHVFHNLHPNYHGSVGADNPRHKDYLIRRLGLDPWNPTHRKLISPAEDLTVNTAYASAQSAEDLATVSPLYMRYGAGSSRDINMGDILTEKSRQGRFSGISNGMDTVNWQRAILRGNSFFECKNRTEREALFERSKHIKANEKSELQREVGLEQREDACVLTMVHRLSEQKGFEISIDTMWSILNKNEKIQIVVAGPPEDSEQGREFKRRLHELQRAFGNRFRYIGGIDPRSNIYKLMYLGADIFMMPSKYEPHGLSQLEAMAAGTVVVARDIDGLSTSITDVRQESQDGRAATGFKFFDFNSREFEKAVQRAIDTYYAKGKIDWNRLVYNCFVYDSRWIKPAKQYINEIYAKNAGVDMERIADIPELIAIFAEPEENLEYTLIKYGYNTQKGLDFVVGDALAKLEEYIKDSRLSVRRLARKFYRKYHRKYAGAGTRFHHPAVRIKYTDISKAIRAAA